MGIKKTWNATLAFRKFREKTHELSKIYWIHQIGVDCINQMLINKNPEAHTVKELNCSFEFRMYPALVKETSSWLPTYMDRSRLYLLVVYSAFLESYLKEITFFYIASQGYLSNPQVPHELMKLTAVGKALGAPIIEKSTIPNMIKYAGHLFDIHFGKNADDWIKIYQIRCEVAHNGGVATPDFLKQISGMKLKLSPNEYEMLGLTWEELRTYMKAGDEIAALIDSKISSYAIQALETEQILRQLKSLKKLPRQNKLWSFVHDEYGLKVKKREKILLERMFY